VGRVGFNTLSQGGDVNNKAKLAIGLGSTCAGCDIYILDLKEKIFDLVALADIVFWPTAMDFKLKDVEKMGEKEIDITLYHGTIRTSEHEHMAHLLREKSKVVIAFGSCACFGGIPGLCNFTSREEIFETCYRDTPSTINPEFVTPKVEVMQDGYTLTLPELHDDGKALHQVVDVDYYLPGCPPPVELIEKLLPIIDDFVKTGNLPPKGTVIAEEKSVCDECPLIKEDKKISRIYRPYEIIPDPERCLLEQGILCMGPATRGGCGACCPKVGMPCRGCLGPTPGVLDQGAKALSAIASILGVESEKDISDESAQELVDQIKDPAGTFYRFGLPVALINKRVKKG
jgi:F420-non-reducing hydrogenase small subunit